MKFPPRMGAMFALPALAALAIAGELRSSRADEAAAVATSVAIGEAVPAFEAVDLDGKPFAWPIAASTPADIESRVRVALSIESDAKECPWATALADLELLQAEDGSLDAAKKADFVRALASHEGLLPNADTLDKMVTLADVRAYLASAASRPVLFVVWSPKCPTCAKLNERTLGAAGKHNLRLIAVAGNAPDKPEQMRQFQEKHGFPVRILMDGEQKITDMLGGKRTPHFILVDAKGILQYRGALDNDLHDVLEGDERKNWLADAVAAIEGGTEIPENDTQPFG